MARETKFIDSDYAAVTGDKMARRIPVDYSPAVAKIGDTAWDTYDCTYGVIIGMTAEYCIVRLENGSESAMTWGQVWMPAIPDLASVKGQISTPADTAESGAMRHGPDTLKSAYEAMENVLCELGSVVHNQDEDVEVEKGRAIVESYMAPTTEKLVEQFRDLLYMASKQREMEQARSAVADLAHEIRCIKTIAPLSSSHQIAVVLAYHHGIIPSVAMVGILADHRREMSGDETEEKEGDDWQEQEYVDNILDNTTMFTLERLDPQQSIDAAQNIQSV